MRTPISRKAKGRDGNAILHKAVRQSQPEKRRDAEASRRHAQKTTRDYSKVEKNECKAFVYCPSLMSISHAVAGPMPLPMALAALAGTRTRDLAGTLTLILALPLTLRDGA